MTPEQHLADVQRRFDEFVDFVITSGPPTPPWTFGDARALFAPGFDIAAELVDALVSSAKVAVDEAAATDFKRQAAALPAQFGFFAETIIAHWKRNPGKAPQRPPIDLGKFPTERPTFEASLIDRSSITPEQLRQAREVQKQAPGDLGRIIQDLGFASEREIASARAASLGLQYIDLTRLIVAPDAAARVPAYICRQYTIVPIRFDGKSTPNKLTIAVADIQTSMGGIDEVRLLSRSQITPVLAAAGDICAAIERTYGPPPQ